MIFIYIFFSKTLATSTNTLTIPAKNLPISSSICFFIVASNPSDGVKYKELLIDNVIADAKIRSSFLIKHLHSKPSSS